MDGVQKEEQPSLLQQSKMMGIFLRLSYDYSTSKKFLIFLNF
jgi:hypothetical protein